MKTAQMFFEDCVGTIIRSAIYLNQTFNLSEVFFLFLSIFGD